MAKNPIKKILVGLDGSKNSLRGLTKAITLAKNTNASITGIFVIQAYPTEMGLIRTMIGNTQSKKYKNFITMAKSKCKRNGIEFVDIVEYGNEGQTIISFAENNNYNIIVIGSRGLSRTKEFFLGSVSNYVVHKSKIPVLIVK